MGDTGETVMSDDDRDKTVFGGPLPGAKPGGGAPFSGQPAPTRPTPAPDADRTIIGGALPTPPPGGPSRVAPSQYPPVDPGGFQPSAPSGDTWLGGPLPASGQQATPQGQYGNIGQGPGTQQQGFFPEVPSQNPAPQAPVAGPKISLADALRSTGLGKGASSNPLIAAAANLLILFGRLRTGLVEMDAVPLMEHVTREIEAFERNAQAAGIDPMEVQVGKYAICGTADDIVQNLPGADRGVWIQYSMVARFFQKRDSGVGFFQEAEKAMQAPAQRYNLLELMLVCLSLGFEGQYRTLPNGAVELARIRAAIYESLRRVKPRPDEDISVHWEAVPMGGRRKFGATPIWVIASIAMVTLVAAFATFSTLISRDGARVVTMLNTLHPSGVKINLERTSLARAFVAKHDSAQIDRISDALREEIAAGSVEVGEKGQFIFVRVGNLLLFDSGKSTVKKAFAPLANRLAETLNNEEGPVRVIGFSDSIPLSGRGRYKTNYDLSLARSTSVADVIKESLNDPERIAVEGKGEADPIGDNATAEGRALNRRVEIMIAREGTF
ncbi:MAG: type VI secretion system protein ImpK [Halocynthiibacter sp.]